MKFRVYKTSDHFEAEEQPCEGAYIYEKATSWSGNKWAIEVNSLEELMKLAEIEGAIVVSKLGYYDDKLPMIEIYDTYRE